MSSFTHLDVFIILLLQILTFFFSLFLSWFIISWFRDEQYQQFPGIQETPKKHETKEPHATAKLGAIKRPSAELLEKKKHPRLMETEQAMEELLDKEFAAGKLS